LVFNKAHLTTGNYEIDSAFRIAMSDIFININPYKAGKLEKEENILMAGMGYWSPWTRDSAINTWSGAGLLIPDVTKNNLYAVLEKEGELRVGSGSLQFWDIIIWITGAWSQYLFTGDKTFLGDAYTAGINTLKDITENEWDEEEGLFRGPASYSDGISAYPDSWAETDDESGIEAWVRLHPDKQLETGMGFPMFTLSTNALFYNAYIVLNLMSKELSIDREDDFIAKAEKLKDSINSHFWNEKDQCYYYLIDEQGLAPFQSSLGNAFLLLFEISPEERIEKIIENQKISAGGIPCMWPPYDRYRISEEDYGRHSGTVWPQIEAMLVDGFVKNGEKGKFFDSLNKLASNVTRDQQFYEIYHPDTGLPYGGIQEMPGNKEHLWPSMPHQAWCATGYFRMIAAGVFGMNYRVDGIFFSPSVPDNWLENISLKSLKYRNMELNLFISGRGSQIVTMTINGRNTDNNFIPSHLSGVQNVEIVLK